MRDSLRRSGRGHSQEFLESLINELGVLIAEATASEVAVHTRNLMIEGIGQVLHLVLVVLRWEIKIDGGCRMVCVCVCVCVSEHSKFCSLLVDKHSIELLCIGRTWHDHCRSFDSGKCLFEIAVEDRVGADISILPSG